MPAKATPKAAVPNDPVEQTVEKFFATFEKAQNAAAIEAIYGEPIAYGDKLILPIASSAQWFGMGGGVGLNTNAEEGGNEGIGGGGGGFAGARPIALAEISEQGVKVIPVVDENRALAAGLGFAAWAVFWTASTLIRIFRK